MADDLHKPNARRGVLFFVVTWTLCCATGLGVLARYGNTPGEAGAAEQNVSALNALALDADRPTVVMYVHPHCPCSVASLESLARLQSRFRDRFATRVVFCVPPGMDAAWHQTRLWDMAGRLPDCQRIVDTGGSLSMAAGAATSGTVAVYETDGQLRFWGGITPSRAHAGDSVGSDALAAYLTGQTYENHTDIFGCPLTGCADAACPAPDTPTP